MPYPGAGEPPSAAPASVEDGFLSSLGVSFLERLPLCLAFFGEDLLCRFANLHYCATFGVAPDSVVGTTVADAMGTNAQDSLRGLKECALGGETVRFSVTAEPEPGRQVNLSGCFIPHRGPHGRVEGFLAVFEDVTERERAMAELSRREGFVNALLEAAVDGILTIDARGVILSVNKAGSAMFGYADGELVNQPMEVLMPPAHAGRHDSYVTAYLSTHRAKIIGRGREVLARRKDGSVFPVQLSVGELRFGDEVRFVGIARDVSDRHAAEERERFLTTHDPLTGLWLRKGFLDECDGRLGPDPFVAARAWAVFSFDVDQFRDINEGLGYHVGDAALKVIVGRLAEVLPRGSILCRVAADEFAAMAPVAGGEHAGALAEALHARIQASFYVERQAVLMRMSIGCALHDGHVRRTEELLTKSELALQQAQHQGGNCVCFYTPEMAAAAGRRTLLTMHLAQAAERRELAVVYQPIVEAVSGRVVAVEALLRWNHPALGAISPGEFIPIAEDSGLIVPITDWLLEAVIEQAGAWHGLGYVQRVYVNVSGQQFLRGRLVERLRELTDRSPHLSGRIGIEITEQAAVRDLDAAVRAISDLSDFDVETAIDDFGTGYSSLSYVQQLPVKKLKIDRSFIEGVPDDARNASLVRAVIGMAHGLGLAVVAEGVETREQREFLVDAGCDMLQGYLFSRPLRAEDVAAVLDRQAVPRVLALPR